MEDPIGFVVETLSFLAVLALLVLTPIGWAMVIVFVGVSAIEAIAKDLRR